MKRVWFTSALAGAVVLGGTAACDDVAGLRSEAVSLNFRVPAAGSRSAGDVAALQAAADPFVNDGRRCARLTAVDVRFSRIDLERADAFDDEDSDEDTDRGEDSDRDTDTDQRDNVRLEDGLTVPIRLNGDPTEVRVDNVPFGTFDEIEFRIDQIRLVGSFGQFVGGVCDLNDPFDVTVPVREKFEIELDEPLVIDEDHQNQHVTILLNPPQWLVINGVVTNPDRLMNERGLRERFRARVRAALRAFEDANRNGEDDRDTDSDRD